MDLQQHLPAFPWRSVVGIQKQICFRRDLQECSALGLTVFRDTANGKERVGEIWKNVVETLPPVDFADALEVACPVFADRGR